MECLEEKTVGKASSIDKDVILTAAENDCNIAVYDSALLQTPARIYLTRRVITGKQLLAVSGQELPYPPLIE